MCRAHHEILLSAHTSVFTYFILISEENSDYFTQLLLLVTVTKCVYCAVRIEYLNIQSTKPLT